jgi:hypothetical protein
MDNEIERNLGSQPLDTIMDAKGLIANDLVSASQDQITHKMVARGRKGRRLTRKVQFKLIKALNAAIAIATEASTEAPTEVSTEIETETEYTLKEVFNY